MHGVLPVVAAIILTAAISLGRQSMHSLWQSAVIVAVAALAITRKASFGLLVAASMTVGVLMALVFK